MYVRRMVEMFDVVAKRKYRPIERQYIVNEKTQSSMLTGGSIIIFTHRATTNVMIKAGDSNKDRNYTNIYRSNDSNYQIARRSIASQNRTD